LAEADKHLYMVKSQRKMQQHKIADPQPPQTLSA
jgi:hypothetical protein